MEIIRSTGSPSSVRDRFALALAFFLLAFGGSLLGDSPADLPGDPLGESPGGIPRWSPPGPPPRGSPWEITWGDPQRFTKCSGSILGKLWGHPGSMDSRLILV